MTLSSRLSDSLHDVKQLLVMHQPIPPSMARTTFPTNMLAAIPVGTGFSTRSGQATVSVERLAGDSLQVTATCDSLSRQVIVLSEELTRIRNELKVQVEEPPPKVVNEPTPWQWFWIRTGQISLALLLLIIGYALIKRRLKRK